MPTSSPTADTALGKNGSTTGIAVAKPLTMRQIHSTPAADHVRSGHAGEVTEGTSCNIYRDVFGAWRWEYRDAHGDMCDSLDSFDTYHECVAAAQREGLMPPADHAPPAAIHA